MSNQTYSGIDTVCADVIKHHGIKDQKWGTRRYRNYDGTLTEEGKKRYYPNPSDDELEYDKNIQKEAAELSTTELAKIKARDNAVEEYNRRHPRKGTGKWTKRGAKIAEFLTWTAATAATLTLLSDNAKKLKESGKDWLDMFKKKKTP